MRMDQTNFLSINWGDLETGKQCSELLVVGTMPATN